VESTTTCSTLKHL